MNKLLKFIIPVAVIPFIAGCGSKPSGDEKHYVTFHQELAEDVKVEFNKNTNDSEIIAQEPKIVAKDGYSAKWEDYTVVGKTEDFTVNAVYTEYTYNVTFRQKGLVVATVPFTAADVKGEHPQLPESRTPACPSDTWYTYKWEDYKLSLNDVVVNAVKDGDIQHIAKFTDGEKVIAENVKFSRKDVTSDGELKKELIPDDVKNYVHDKEHPTWWDTNWDFKIPLSSDLNITFDANVTKHNFELKFIDFDKKQVGDIVNYQFDTDWSKIEKPEAPKKVGYTVSWPKNITYTYSTDSPMEVSPDTPIANKYTVSYEGKPDKDTFTFDGQYKLKYSQETADDLTMWHYNEIPVSNEGVWTIPDNVTLSKKEVTDYDFENNYMPKFIYKWDVGTPATVSMTSEMASKGRYAVKIDGTNGGNCRLIINMSYLANIFKDDKVQSFAFDMYSKDTEIQNNIEFDYVDNNGARARLSPVVKFEGDLINFGITNRWKTFYLERSTYNALLATNTQKCMIYADFKTGESSNKVLYFDNMRKCYGSLTDHIDFEGGIIYPGDTKIYRQNANSGNTFYHAGIDAKYGVVSWSFDDKWSSKDKYSLKMTNTPADPKAGCYVGFYISEKVYNALPDEGLKFDFYTDHFIGANALQYGNNDNITEITRIPGGTSVTITVPKNKITTKANDRRFFIANGNASKQNPEAGTGDWTVFCYNFDNIRPATED